LCGCAADDRHILRLEARAIGLSPGSAGRFEILDEDLQIATESIQRAIAVGSSDSARDHLGEAASIALFQRPKNGRLISDDHGARAEARKRGVAASSTVGVVAQLLGTPESGVDRAMADIYLETLQAGAACTRCSRRSTCWPDIWVPGNEWDTTSMGAPSWAIFYVQVNDVAAAICKAESLGATVAIPLVDNGRIEFAHLVDTRGNRFGIWRPKQAG
jgi:hypothetical protein